MNTHTYNVAKAYSCLCVALCSKVEISSGKSKTVLSKNLILATFFLSLNCKGLFSCKFDGNLQHKCSYIFDCLENKVDL